MTHFLEALSSAIKDHGITIYSLAATSGIERSYLSKILSGKRSMSTENFSNIMSAVPFSIEEDKALRELFISEFYGKDRYENYVNIINNISELTDIKSHNPNVIKVSLVLDGDMVRFDSTKDFVNIIEAVIDTEMAKEKDGRLYTNIDTELLFDIVRKYPQNPNVDFRQLVAIGNDSVSYSKILSQTLKFGMLRYPVNYYNTADLSERSNGLFPCYLVSSDICVFADAEYKEGYLIKNKDIADVHAERFFEVLKNTGSYVDRMDDIMESKALHAEILKDGCEHAYAIENCFCAPFHMSHSMWAQIAKSDIPNREFLIDSTYEYYCFFKNSIEKITTVISKSGLTSFVENGIVSQMPREYALPLTSENRLRVLENFREFYSNGSNQLYLIKENVFHIKDNIDAEVFDNRNKKNAMNMLLAIASERQAMKFVGNFCFNFSDKNTIVDFLDFINCFIVSGCCYTQEESLAIVDEEIRKIRYDLNI